MIHSRASEPEFDPSAEGAERLDALDPLAGFRAHFHLPPGRIYLDGNSLGLLSLDVEAAVLGALDEWKRLAIGGWLSGEPPWFTLAEGLAAQIALLIGARPEEVAVANSTTVNLHQLLVTLCSELKPPRTKILAFGGEFPSDLQAIRSHLRQRGLDPVTHLSLLPAGLDGLLDEDLVAHALETDRTLAAAVLPSVVYTTGQLLDLPRLARSARRGGVLAGFDLSHSIGAVPHALTEAGVDFAFWCHYKYLNAGPGAVGGLYLNARHFGRAAGLAGWWGIRKDRMFDVPDAGEPLPAVGAAALQIGTPDVLSLAALRGALNVTAEAGLDRLWEKSLLLTDYLMRLVEANLPEDAGVAIANPRADHQRGGHVALAHPKAGQLCRALAAAGVVTDHRPPDILRLAPAPLYNSFADCHAAVERLRSILLAGTYENETGERSLVP